MSRTPRAVALGLCLVACDAPTTAAAVTELRERVETAAERARRGDPRPAAAMFVAGPDSALGTYGRLSMAHEQLGPRNVFGDTAQRHFEPSTEAFIDARPEVPVALCSGNGILAVDGLERLADQLGGLA